MRSDEIRSKFLEFFKKRGHAIIPSASLVPENDPSVLFNTAGMQPLVPYLLGQKHPAGTRLVDVQKCVRTGDIDDIGDNRHLSFFEMLGNWSLGDYFKKESIPWSFEFLTSKEEGLGLDPTRFYVTVFRGEQGIPRDEEAIKIWQETFAKSGINPEGRIFELGVEDNFWIAGTSGPCGGDTEIFYDTKPEAGTIVGNFNDYVNSYRLLEVWNNVFMEFNKTPEGKYEKLAKQNVDTGMGLERTTVVVNGKENVFETDCFETILKKIDELGSVTNEKARRVVADHLRTAVFMIADGVTPSNTDRGYVLRRLLRRAVRYADMLEISANKLEEIAEVVIEKYAGAYPEVKLGEAKIKSEISGEETKFRQTLQRGMKEFEKINGQNISGQDAFKLFTTYGFPFELTKELAKDKGVAVDEEAFKLELGKHQELSRVGAEQKFKGGLASTGEMETKYHTATHLLLAALRNVLGGEIVQKGSNITAERLRFDFNWPEKLTAEQLKSVEDLVNQKISEKITVEKMELPKEEAKKIVTTLSFDLSKYGDVVSVYKIGNFSTEFCGGPHVGNTSELGHFKIKKEEAVAAGIRRIKAVID
jgi:alanyl-tRNA synthetase